MKKLIAGNWKMNCTVGQGVDLVSSINTGHSGADVLVCPPFTIIADIARLKKQGIFIGAQDCHAQESGAYTGNVSAAMLKDLGCDYVIVGHSERRSYHHETDQVVAEKAQAAIQNDLIPIICVGETLEDRERAAHIDVVIGQVNHSLPQSATPLNSVIAYEPIWAIGTGKTASTDDIDEMHGAIRRTLVERFGEEGQKIRILYGGSMKPENAKDILSVQNVDGGLIGGASLKADDFNAIIESA